MGWASGSIVANSIWDNIRHLIDPENRPEVAQAIIRALEGNDWDTQDESPLLMADAGETPYWGESIEEECSFCDKSRSFWRGNAPVLTDHTQFACHNCVHLLEDPVMVS